MNTDLDTKTVYHGNISIWSIQEHMKFFKYCGYGCLTDGGGGVITRDLSCVRACTHVW